MWVLWNWNPSPEPTHVKNFELTYKEKMFTLFPGKRYVQFFAPSGIQKSDVHEIFLGNSCELFCVRPKNFRSGPKKVWCTSKNIFMVWTRHWGLVRVKNADFRPKIEKFRNFWCPKFRPGCPARPKLFFLNYLNPGNKVHIFFLYVSSKFFTCVGSGEGFRFHKTHTCKKLWTYV